MYRKIIIVCMLALLGTQPLFAESRAAKLARPNLEASISEIQQIGIDMKAFDSYLEAIKTVEGKPYSAFPSYESVREAIQKLTKYNSFFENEKVSTQDKFKLAAALNREFETGWNSYRPIGLSEIFDECFPEENQDEDIIAFEYNMKRNLLSTEQRDLMASFKESTDVHYASVYAAYEQFAQTVQEMPARDDKAIVSALLEMVKVCNDAEENLPGIKKSAKDSLFFNPILTRWGRVTAVRDLREKALNINSGGEVGYYTIGALQKKFNLCEADAVILDQFVRKY